eukprot:CAMPEP_0176109344 /NCGR_PEP_ID=MMETSP0120_2-20121206/54897_1 /TAXON_ID=160619 /ORGANISM="Kryptoperidinium foliaceum, Strain CCMP 1326" /LENGTH=207 /DNA_ID=CAMNT_0017443527 /DNA_START=82 /DNA_END=702 /DNA_ORIENTATION=-
MPAFDFWDINEILAEEYKVTAKPSYTIASGGVLLPSAAGSECKDLPADTKVQVPFWLAQSLARRNSASIELPTDYNSNAQEDLGGDPVACRLGDKSGYYFEIGLRIGHLLHNQGLVDTLFAGLQQRWVEIVTLLGSLGVARMEASQLNPTNSSFPATLTYLEHRMFCGGKEAEAQFKRWTDMFGAFKMKASQLVDAPLAKRARTAKA